MMSCCSPSEYSTNGLFFSFILTVFGVVIGGNPFLGLVLTESYTGVFVFVFYFDFAWWSVVEAMSDEDDCNYSLLKFIGLFDMAAGLCLVTNIIDSSIF